MNLKAFKESGHWPTLLTSFLYFDFSFMVWTMLGVLGLYIAEALHLSVGQKTTMVAVPILAGAVLRILLGFLVDRIGAKNTGLLSQTTVILALAAAWQFGLPNYGMTLVMGLALGVAGASFAVALPQAGRWYPPKMQGAVMGLAGAGNVGVVIDYVLAPVLAKWLGWQNVFGCMLIPAVAVLAIYWIFSKEAPGEVRRKKPTDYLNLLKEKDAHWFCFYYTVSFGGFSGLAAFCPTFLNEAFGFSKGKASLIAAFCVFAGAMVRPLGGMLADRVGGIRALTCMYAIAAVGLSACAFTGIFPVVLALFIAVSAAFGMANGAVFQLLPQRFGKDIGLMTGLVGCGGGVGGFIFAYLLGHSKEWINTYQIGFLVFAAMCATAVMGVTVVKTRWRTTWGAAVDARI